MLVLAFPAIAQTDRLEGTSREERGRAMLRQIVKVRPPASNEIYPKSQRKRTHSVSGEEIPSAASIVSKALRQPV
jgi:hypothetical protein